MTRVDARMKLENILSKVGQYYDYNEEGEDRYHIWGDLLVELGGAELRCYKESEMRLTAVARYENITDMKFKSGELYIYTVQGRWV